MIYIHHLSPIAFEYGFITIRYYGLVYVLGFVLVWWFVRYASKRKGISFPWEAQLDFIFALMLGVLLGGRLGYVLLYDPVFFFFHPLDVFKIWEGGMSFHGALVGVLWQGWRFCLKKGYSFWMLADLVVIPLSFVLILGRMANFINGELYGKITDGSWGVLFPGQTQLRHPSQLYEAVKNLVIFSVLSFCFYRYSFKPGTLFWLFVFLYGVLRFVVEFWREPDWVWGLSAGQWYCLGMVLVSVYVFVKKRRWLF